MMEITRNQPAEIVAIFSSSPASALMHEEFDAIDILENPRLGADLHICFRPLPIDLIQLALLVESDQFSDLPPVNLRRSKAQLLFKRLFQDFNIAVLAENQRHHQPIISGANLAVSPVITEERATLPMRDVGRSPIVLNRLFVEGQGIVPNVASVEHRAFLDRFRGLSNKDTIHEYSSAWRQVLSRKF